VKWHVIRADKADLVLWVEQPVSMAGLLISIVSGIKRSWSARKQAGFSIGITACVFGCAVFF
jgi:hypothetical protein